MQPHQLRDPPVPRTAGGFHYLCLS